jgi:hypothetical protein
MNTYETTATVEDHGRLRLAGVPFAPGTLVEVTISPKTRSDGELAHSDQGVSPDAGLRWEGNVLVHHGSGAAPSVAEAREERLNRLGEGSSG